MLRSIRRIAALPAPSGAIFGLLTLLVGITLGLTLREHPVTVAPLHTRVITWDGIVSPTYQNTFVLDDLPVHATVVAQLSVSGPVADNPIASSDHIPLVGAVRLDGHVAPGRRERGRGCPVDR